MSEVFFCSKFFLNCNDDDFFKWSINVLTLKKGNDVLISVRINLLNDLSCLLCVYFYVRSLNLIKKVANILFKFSYEYRVRDRTGSSGMIFLFTSAKPYKLYNRTDVHLCLCFFSDSIDIC